MNERFAVELGKTARHLLVTSNHVLQIKYIELKCNIVFASNIIWSTIDINAVCISLCNYSLVLFAGDLKFFLNTMNVEDWKLLKLHFDALQNRGLDKGMKQNPNKTTFTLFILETNGTNFACTLDCTHIDCYCHNRVDHNVKQA